MLDFIVSFLSAIVQWVILKFFKETFTKEISIKELFTKEHLAREHMRATQMKKTTSANASTQTTTESNAETPDKPNNVTMVLTNTSVNEEDLHAGFMKDSSLGDAYSTNGINND